MADTTENLIAFLLDDSSLSSSLGTQVGQMRALQEWEYPQAIVFRTGTDGDTDRTLDQAVGIKPFRQFYDIEIVSDDVDEAVDIADRVKVIADGFNGTFGATTCQGIFVEDHDDSYQPRGVDEDEAVYIQALRVEILGVA
jgi:uncharacterized protein YheU (UPF0270 family)